MRNNKHTGFGKEAILVTRSPRYLAGTRANKPKYYTKKKNRGRPMWLTEKLLREWERQERADQIRFLKQQADLGLVMRIKPRF